MSASLRSLIVPGNARPPAQPPQFFMAYGEPDDHLRLTVLLAEHFASSVADTEEEARICTHPQSSWTERHAALQSLLAKVPSRQSAYVAGLIDIDALYPDGSDTWEDPYTSRLRKDFFTTLKGAVARGGWVLVRPSVSHDISQELSELDVDVHEPSNDIVEQTGVHRAVAFAPECQPVVSWLIQRRILHPVDLKEIVETVVDFDAHVLAVAYDSLQASIRNAAKMLAAVRPAQHLNGSLGAFQFSERLDTGRVPRRAVDTLRECGFLQPAPGLDDSSYFMPRSIRSMLSRHARFSQEESLRQTHCWLASRPLEECSTAEQLEIHHHAVRAEDVELAKKTARFYGIELRTLATQFSRARHYKPAAELFELLVQQFDKNDPYAWEYLGYNLARAHGRKAQEQVLKAYKEAHQIVPSNPLYHGRLLGFRGEIGENVVQDFERGLTRYIHVGEDAVSFFVEAVLKGLKRSNRRAQIREILERWGRLLERFAPRVLTSLNLPLSPPEEGI